MNTRQNAGMVLSLTLGWLMLTAAHAAPPPNDSVLKAIQFRKNYEVFTTPDVNLATAASTDPLINGVSAGKTVWYRIFNPPYPTYSANFSLTVRSITGLGSTSLYSGDPDNPLTGLGTGTTAALAPGQSHTYANVSAAGTYFVMIAGKGVFELTYRLSPPLYHNDFPTKASSMGGDFSSVTGGNHLSTVSADEPVLPIAIANTVWYSWTPTFSGTAFADTNFSFVSYDQGGDPLLQMVHDTVLAVYSGTPNALSLIGWDNNSGWNNNSRVAFSVVSGTNYYLGVSTAAGTPPGYFQLNCYRGNTAGEVTLSPGSIVDSFSENVGTRVIKVRRRYAGNFSASVQMASIAGGTATSGVDFQALNTTVNFALPATGDSAWEGSAILTINDDLVSEPAETVRLQLSSPSANTTLGQNLQSFLTIIDNDSLQTNAFLPFELVHRTVYVREGAGRVTLNTLLRTSLLGQNANVVQTPIAGAANRDTEYSLYAASIGPDVPSIPLQGDVYDDAVFELDETITVEVSIPFEFSTPKNTYTIIIADDDPYIPLPGRLVAPLDYGARKAQFFATTTTAGALTGKLFLIGETLPVKAQLDWRGMAMVNLLPKGRTAPLVLRIQATDATGGFKITINDGAMGSVASANAVLQNYSKTDPCPEAGYYTFSTNGISTVACSQAGAITVDASGNAMVAARLFDGTAYTAAGYVDGDGRMGALGSLFAGQGMAAVQSQLPLAANQETLLRSHVLRPARSGDPAKLGYFNLQITGTVCQYSAPMANQQALEAWLGGTGKAVLSSGPLNNGTLEKMLTINPQNLIGAPADAEKLKLTVMPKTGIFTGSVVLPGTTKALSIYGALIDLPTMNGYGQGFFFDGLKGGKIVIGKP